MASSKDISLAAGAALLLGTYLVSVALIGYGTDGIVNALTGLVLFCLVLLAMRCCRISFNHYSHFVLQVTLLVFMISVFGPSRVGFVIGLSSIAIGIGLLALGRTRNSV